MQNQPLKTVLIAGVLGQDGAYLAEHALRLGCTVIGGVRDLASVAQPDRAWRLQHLKLVSRVRLVEFDLRDSSSMATALQAHRPDAVFNLAAVSSVAQSFQSPIATTEVTGMGALRLFEAARQASWPIRVLQPSSADILVDTVEGPVRAASPYGAAKAFAHLMARVYRDSMGVFISTVVLFNHESPLRGPEFVTRKIVSTLVDIRAGRPEHLLLGNLNARRDWSHARDIVDGMWRIVGADQAGEYVLGSGRVHTVREFVEKVAVHLGFDLDWIGTGTHETAVDRATGRLVVAIDPGLFRPTDTTHPIVDLSKARQLGWEPRIQIDEMIAEMVEFELAARKRGTP